MKKNIRLCPCIYERTTSGSATQGPHGCRREERDIITDKVSGKDLEREGYQSLKNHFLRDGDTLIVKSLDRLSRRKIDIKKELEYFREHHIRIKILDIPTTMVELPDEQDWIFEMINNILIEVLASIAEQERITTKRRQSEGIAIAKRGGEAFGAPNDRLSAKLESILS